MAFYVRSNKVHVLKTAFFFYFLCQQRAEYEQFTKLRQGGMTLYFLLLFFNLFTVLRMTLNVFFAT